MLLSLIALAAVILCMKPLGAYIARVMQGDRSFLTPVMEPLERVIYRFCATTPETEMRAGQYAFAVLAFTAGGMLLLFMLLVFQQLLPLNPQEFEGLPWDLAFNAAASFVTNTNWQSYGGESTLSHFSQMAGMGVQNFLSAATGIAVACALFRSFARRNVATIGNFWVDMTRSTLYVLLPLSLLFAVLLASQGVVQNFAAPVSADLLEGGEQAIATGPAASQVAIKMLGSNGGGFFNANSAHPFENPTPFSNFLQMVSILLLPAAMIWVFGVMVLDRRQSLALLAAVLLLFVPFAGLAMWQEYAPNAALDGVAVSHEGNMEGKEMRFGAASSAFWSIATTATSNGSVNAMHASFQPLSTFAQMLMMQMGEVVFGGAGSGMYGLLMFVLLTVFIGGLMVGRTPEYLGKKLGPFEIKMASVAILAPCALALIGAALAVSVEAGREGVLNSGARGFSEILYAFTSAANNNGSAMAGLGANTPFYNVTLGIIMLLSRFMTLLPALAVAGALAARNTVPKSAGTMPTHTPLFIFMLAGTILLLGALSHIPALALGPVVEQLELSHL